MYQHVVMWRVKRDAGDRTAAAREIKRRLETLPGVIPEIRHYEVGVNIGAYGASFFDVSLVASFEHRAAFERYISYPEHDAVVAFITAQVEAEEIVDYEV